MNNRFALCSRAARRLAGCGVAAALLLSQAVLAQQGWDQPPASSSQGKLSDKELLHADPYTRAMAFKQKGQYSEAMPLLEAMAIQGHGFEVAKLELGKCYFDLARQATTPDAIAHSRTQGFAWILAAADEGFGLAEQEMVRLYLNGPGVPIDRVEAAKWYLLWRHNPERMQIGTSQFDVGLETQLNAVARPADWKDAQQRADQWHAF
jgi:TPR repeat protein